MRLTVLVVVTHLLGAGHLTRSAAIGRALAAAGHAVTLVSGGMPARLVATDGVRFVQLPPVRAGVDDFTTLLDGEGRPIGPGHLRAREAGLLAAFREARPDVVVTELFPFGRRVLAAEHMTLLGAAAQARPKPLVLCSIRDILVAPDDPAKARRTHDILARHYDAVLVHGDEALMPLDASWPVDDALRRRLAYTGYVDGERPPVPDLERPQAEMLAGGEPRRDRTTILVSGGSSAASLPLYRAALAAARGSGRPWHLLVGTGVDEAEYRTLGSDLEAEVRIERARSDFRDLLRKAAVFVGQAGYNTVMDIVATETRSVLVPFERGRETEQRLRAEALAGLGQAKLLPEKSLTPQALAAAIEETGRRPRPVFSGIRLDGAERSVALIERMSRRVRAEATP